MHSCAWRRGEDPGGGQSFEVSGSDAPLSGSFAAAIWLVVDVEWEYGDDDVRARLEAGLE